MKELADEIATLTLGQPTAFRNLTLFPLLRQEPPTVEPDYLLSEDAISQGLARIVELGGGGSVPELQFENGADKPVLLLDGEELVGAQQNRVLNLTILAAAKTTVIIPVSCVEAGRWQMQSPEFKPADHVMYARGRAARAGHVTESMRTTGTRRSDQSAVWQDIARKAERMDAPSPTHRMAAAYERHALSVEEYVRAFSLEPLQAGIVFVIDGATAGVDMFDHPATMRRFFPKLIRSYALDALDPEPEKSGEAILDGSKLLALVSAAPTSSAAAIGLGKDIRIAGNGLSGGALWAEGRYVHVCAFAEGSSTVASPIKTRMSRPTRRYRL
jgi:hypothetical protein